MARDHQASPRARGLREAIRALAATRHAVLISRTKAINELKSLIIVAPEHLRASLRGRPLARQLDCIEAMTTSADATVEHRITTLTLQSITARIRFLAAQLAELDPELTQLVRQHPAGPALLAEPGSWTCRGCPDADRLVSPRPGPGRGRLRLPGWRRAAGS